MVKTPKPTPPENPVLDFSKHPAARLKLRLALEAEIRRFEASQAEAERKELETA